MALTVGVIATGGDADDKHDNLTTGQIGSNDGAPTRRSGITTCRGGATAETSLVGRCSWVIFKN